MHHQQQQQHHHHSHQTNVSSLLNRQPKYQQQQQGHYPQHQQQQIKYGHQQQQQQQQFHSAFESFLQIPPTSASAVAISQQQQSLNHHKHHHHNSQMAPSRIIGDDDFRSNNSSTNQSLLSLNESGDQDQDEQSTCGYGPVIEHDDIDYDDDDENDGGDDDNEQSNNMNSNYNSSWIFKEDFIINHTPSRRQGINYADEIEYRRKGTKFIRDLTKLLKMKPICKETAYVYFHRFFMLRSFRQYDPIRIAMASLYFACKYEDHPLPKDHLIQVSYLLINNYVNKQQPSHKLNKDDKEYIEYCDRLIMDENLMIQLLGFDNLRVTHFQVLVVESYSRNPIQGTTQELYTAAYQIASELNRLTTLCLEYPAPFLAAVSIYLAACYKTIRLPDDWCQTMMTDVKNPMDMKKLVIQIGEKYRESLSSSQLIQKILTEEYRRQYGSPPSNVMKKSNEQKSNSTIDQQKQHPTLGALLMTNFSPDSAYSSSSSTAAAYSPAEQPQLQPVNSTPSSSNISGDRKSRLQINQQTAGGRNVRSIMNPISVSTSQSQQQPQQQTRYSMANKNNNNNYQSNNNNMNQQQQQQSNKKRSATNVMNNNNFNDGQFNFAQQQQQSSQKIDFSNINQNNNNDMILNRNNLNLQHYRSLINVGNINNNNNNNTNQLSRNLQQHMNNNGNKKFKSNHAIETLSNEYYRHNNNNNNYNRHHHHQQQMSLHQQDAAYTIQQQLGIMFQNSVANGVGGGGGGGNNNTSLVTGSSFQQQQQQHHRKNL
ncbi:uncharacterized protein LOC113795975 isoform X2 [Dermatophagoides pteronyssinus]